MNSDTENGDKVISEHHIQQELCTTRLPYRQGRKFTAVKVYSVASESQHLLIFGVPSLNLRAELKSLCSKYGQIKVFSNTSEYPCEQFTETFRVSYQRIQSARVAKRFIDTKNFYGGVLHACYAPELESIDETRKKLLQRRRDVSTRLRKSNDTRMAEEMENYENLYDVAGKTVKNIYEKEKIIKDGIVDECEKNVDESEAKRMKLDEKIVNIRKKPIKMKIVYEKQYKPCFRDSSSALLQEAESGTAEKNGEMSFLAEDTYKTFGKEDVRIIPEKKLNKIVFFVKKK